MVAYIVTSPLLPSKFFFKVSNDNNIPTTKNKTSKKADNTRKKNLEKIPQNVYYLKGYYDKYTPYDMVNTRSIRRL